LRPCFEVEVEEAVGATLGGAVLGAPPISEVAGVGSLAVCFFAFFDFLVDFSPPGKEAEGGAGTEAMAGVGAGTGLLAIQNRTAARIRRAMTAGSRPRGTSEVDVVAVSAGATAKIRSRRAAISVDMAGDDLS
jgi:hypothetical protein